MAVALRESALKAYLGPLLKKHEEEQDITFEDLMNSKVAADAALSSFDNDESVADEVTKEVEQLHRNQLQAYMETAEAELESWVTNQVSKYHQEGGGDNVELRKRILQMGDERPNFRVGAKFWQRLVLRVLSQHAAFQGGADAAEEKEGEGNAHETDEGIEAGETEEDDAGELEDREEGEEDSAVAEDARSKEINDEETAEMDEGEIDEDEEDGQVDESKEDAVMEEEGEVEETAAGEDENAEDGESEEEDGQIEENEEKTVTAADSESAAPDKATSATVSSGSVSGKNSNSSRKGKSVIVRKGRAGKVGNSGGNKKQVPARRKPLPAKPLMSGKTGGSARGGGAGAGRKGGPRRGGGRATAANK